MNSNSENVCPCCGHYLHHNMNKDGSEDLLSGLSDAEKKELILLLKKCLNCKDTKNAVKA